MLKNSNKIEAGQAYIDAESFHVFSAMFRSKAVASMGIQAFGIYSYIKSCVNPEIDDYPTVSEIAEYTGLSRATVLRELPKLETLGYITKTKVGRKTAYKILERITIQDNEGNEKGVATWEYIPRMTAKAVDEVRAILAGNLNPAGAHFVHIENVQVIVSHLEEGAVQNNIQAQNVDAKDSLRMSERGIKRLDPVEDQEKMSTLAAAVRPTMAKALEQASSEDERLQLQRQLDELDQIISKNRYHTDTN
ncbi:TPA: helix-turn-helix domain-containing protein [Acinetobacter baumannii]|nr:helix-turn-helix domain-containing protein [Acinetobacter baumannii]HCW3892771.1 helix-turn-helix domain-containing protein [Acinetobacter baumannii]